MADVNKVFLIGRLTVDPRPGQTNSGTSVLTLPVACNRTFTTKGGEKREDTTFVDVVAWGPLAETCRTYLGKGSQVHVEGHLKQETWNDRNTGEKRSKIVVEAESIQFLDRRKADAAPPDRPLDSRRAINEEFDPTKPSRYAEVPQDDDDPPF